MLASETKSQPERVDFDLFSRPHDCSSPIPGALRGATLTSCFPPSVRADLETHCAAALGGAGARFSCVSDGERLQFDAVPVRAADGRIVYGLLMTDVKVTSPNDAAAEIV